MKIALCFSGMPRFIRECYDSYNENILSKHDVDVFYYLWNDVTTAKYDSTNPDNKNYQYNPSKIDDFINLYKPKDGFFADYTDDYDLYLKNYVKKYKDPMRRFNSINWKTISMFQGIEGADLIRQRYQHISKINYDVVIRCRTDILLYSEIDFTKMVQNTVNMSVANASGGINDTFWFSDPVTAAKFSQLKTFCDNFDHTQLTYKDFPHEALLYCLAYFNQIKIAHTLDNQVIYRFRIEKGQPDHLCREGLWLTDKGWKGDFGNRWILDRLV